MVKKAGKGAAGEGQITVARLQEILGHIEWQCRVTRVALHQLDPATRIQMTPELEELLAQEPRAAKYAEPLC
jgi:hypothetical protein